MSYSTVINTQAKYPTVKLSTLYGKAEGMMPTDLPPGALTVQEFLAFLGQVLRPHLSPDRSWFSFHLRFSVVTVKCRSKLLILN